MSYGWIILTDHLGDPEAPQGSPSNEAGTMGPRGLSAELRERLVAGEGLTFKLYDDDDELYYTGRIVGVGDDTRSLPEEALAPLDDFGAPNAGCTMIKYRVAGRWEVL